MSPMLADGGILSQIGSGVDKLLGTDVKKPLPKGYGFADGGSIEDEEQMEHHDSIAAAIMAKRDRMHAMIDSGAMDEDKAVKMAEGGQVDLDLNSMEQPNKYYGRNEDDVLKENYDEPIHSMSQPMDSNEHGDDIDSDKHDMVSAIRKKMKSRKQF